MTATIAAFLDRPVPRATYRLQLNRTFTFRQAEAIVPYLASLGVSHVYVSPILKAVPGSMHGYDVVDYGTLNPEIGTRADFDSFVSVLHERGLRLIVDFVPNHMGIENGQNAWWQDVLEHGEQSPYAGYFDIDWSPVKQEIRGKVLLPFLGDQYGAVLERGELKLVFENGEFLIHYWDQPLPISPATYPLILRRVDERLDGQIAEDDLDLLELRSVRTALERLDSLLVNDEAAPLETEQATWRQEQTLAKHRLNALCERSPVVGRAVSEVVAAMNGVPGESATFDALDELLDHQHYRLSSWRVAAEEINYRRFFAINSLAAIRQEVPEVFDDTHCLIAELVADGRIDGLRIDHPDGLWDPAGYFRSLQRLVIEVAVRRRLDHDRAEPLGDDAWAASRTAVRAEIDAALDELAPGARWPLYVVAEKILEHGETLRDDWAVAGTVGYEFAQAATGVFVEGAHRQRFDRLYAQYTGDRIDFHDLVYDMKQRMMYEAFASEVNVLANELNRISERDRHFRDFTLNNLRNALREILACFSVYRTYTTTDELAADNRDRRYIESAVAQAKRRNPAIDMSVFDFIAGVMLNAVPEDPAVPSPARRNRFSMKLQQLSGPVMAKGLEDTAFYRFNRLVSLNEVGGDPSRFGTAVEEFHVQNQARRRSWPAAMINSSTHDTKRAEDVRARINVLSEIPVEWRATLGRWSRANRRLKRRVDGVLAPRRADEYVLYQTLVGTWPLLEPDAEEWERYVLRIQEYIVKVGREANRFTNWVNPNEAYEGALKNFVAGILDVRRSGVFLADLRAFIDRVADAGMRNALGQQVLKLTSPGVPDLYQGTELWDDSLVDPDNRRPVDFDIRAALLASGDDAGSLWNDRRNGTVKLAVTKRLLEVRARHPDLFAAGDYTSLSISGDRQRHAVAFSRRREREQVLVVVARLTAGLDPGDGDGPWANTRIVLPDHAADSPFTDVLTGATPTISTGDDGQPTLMLSELLFPLPVAVLLSSGPEEGDAA